MKIIKLRGNFKKAVEVSVKALRRGKAVILPTDTVYGLICDATSKKAVGKIFKIKQRLKTKPLPIFVKNIKQAEVFAAIDKDQKKFLKNIWPGRITAVLKIKTQNTKIYGVDKKTIAFRIPGHRLVFELLNIIGNPLVGTSANLSGQPASGGIGEVLRQFKGRKYQPDLVVDAGNLPKRKASKIIDLTKNPPKIIRS